MQKGTTLVEILLYIALASMIFSLVVGIAFSAFTAYNQTSKAYQLEKTGESVMTDILNQLRQGENVANLGPGEEASIIVVEIEGVNQVEFFLEEGVIKISRNQSKVTNLHSSEVIAENLSFSNRSLNAEQDIVTVEFTLRAYGDVRAEEVYTKTFTDTAYLRNDYD